MRGALAASSNTLRGKEGGIEMAAKAYILIETKVGTTRDALQALQKVPGVRHIDAVTGPYDIIAVVDAEGLDAVGELVTSHIHSISGVVRTVTCLAFR